MAESDENGKNNEDILILYEELFKLRYTEDDPDYKETFNQPSVAPPCVSNWFVKQKQNDWGKQGDRNDNRERGRQSNYDNRGYNREWGRQSNYDNRGYRDRSYDRNRGYDNRQSYQRHDNRDYRQDYHRR